jgi:hypothetical protein
MKKSVLPGSAAEPTTRRSFLKKAAVTAGAATIGAGLLGNERPVYARDDDDDESGSLTRGDAAILRFLQALETIEGDLWRQYAELRVAEPATTRRRHAQIKEGSRLSSPDPSFLRFARGRRGRCLASFLR